NVQEPDRIAARISPTNLGLLFNVRQAACQFGYLTIPDFLLQTQQTMATLTRLERHRGHLFNWYDTRTLQPLPPLFISSVDSGNLAASLWALEQGCLEQLRQPLLQLGPAANGILDYVRLLAGSGTVPRGLHRRLRRKIAAGKPLLRLDCLQQFD